MLNVIGDKSNPSEEKVMHSNLFQTFLKKFRLKKLGIILNNILLPKPIAKMAGKKKCAR